MNTLPEGDYRTLLGARVAGLARTPGLSALPQNMDALSGLFGDFGGGGAQQQQQQQQNPMQSPAPGGQVSMPPIAPAPAPYAGQSLFTPGAFTSNQEAVAPPGGGDDPFGRTDPARTIFGNRPGSLFRNVDWGDATDNVIANRALSLFHSSPFAFGPAYQGGSPTFWVNYPGVGSVPMAIPVTGWTQDPSQKPLSLHTPRKLIS